MSYGQAVQKAREEAGVTQDQISLDLFHSRQMQSHIETGKRKPQKDTAKRYVDELDCPYLVMETKCEYTNGLSSPVFEGRAIDKHRMSLLSLAETELIVMKKHIDEAMDALRMPPEHSSEEERKRIESAVIEIVEARACLENLEARLIVRFKLSIKKIYRTLKARWKSKKWI